MSDMPMPAMPPREPEGSPVPARVDLDTLAPMPVEPPPPAGMSMRTRVLLGIGVAVTAVAVMVAFLALRPKADPFPEQIGSYGRMHDAQARSFEDLVSGFDMGEVTIEGALYGEPRSSTPALIVELIAGDRASLQVLPLEGFMRDAAGGFAGTGAGSIDADAAVSDTRDGIGYSCAPVTVTTSTVFAGDSVVCAWKGPDDLGIVFITDTADIDAGFDRTELVYASLHG